MQKPNSIRPTGDIEIDVVRAEIPDIPTGPENFWERITLLWAWMVVLQRLGADVSPFFPALDRIEDAPVESDLSDACAAVDEAFTHLESVFLALEPLAPAEISQECLTPAGPGHSWPMYGGNSEHTASVQSGGPNEGKIAWKFPTGLAWTCRPLVVDEEVYVTSPGIRNLCWCLDLKTGAVKWKSQRKRTGRPRPTSHVLPQSYVLPAAASTPMLHGDDLLIAEMGAQGLNRGERGLLRINRKTGTCTGRKAIGFADYRVGCAKAGSNQHFVVHPDSNQRIEESPPQCLGHHRLLCRRIEDGELLWDFPIGLTFSDPVLDEDRVYAGTNDGMVFALRLGGRAAGEQFGTSDADRIVWTYNAGAAVNSAIEINDSLACFGSNSGEVVCLDKESGSLCWRVKLESPESRAFQNFSKPRMAGERVYLGSASKHLYCLDLNSGELIWKAALSDWVRAQPVVENQTVIAFTMDGASSRIDLEGSLLEQIKLSDFPFLADPVLAGGKLLLNDAQLVLHAVDLNTFKVSWEHHLLQHLSFEGRLVRSDEMGCGGFYQSKPTTDGQTVFVGAPSRFVYGIDSATGEEKWRFEMGGAISGAPAYQAAKEGPATLLIGQQGGEDDFYGLDPETGQLRWRQTLGWVWSSATLADGRAFIPACDGHFNCLEASTGKILWRYRSVRAAHPESPVDQGRVFFGSWDHFVYAFDAASGRLLWKFHTGGSPDSGAPIASDGRVYVPMGGKRLCCLDASSGDILWEIRPQRGCMNASPALSGKQFFISVSVRSGAIPPQSEIRCLDADSGKQVWAHPGGGITGPTVSGDSVFFASTSHTRFIGVNREGNGDGTTSENLSVDLGDRIYESVPALSGKRAFILVDDGYLVAIT